VGRRRRIVQTHKAPADRIEADVGTRSAVVADLRVPCDLAEPRLARSGIVLALESAADHDAGALEAVCSRARATLYSHIPLHRHVAFEQGGDAFGRLDAAADRRRKALETGGGV